MQISLNSGVEPRISTFGFLCLIRFFIIPSINAMSLLCGLLGVRLYLHILAAMPSHLYLSAMFTQNHSLRLSILNFYQIYPVLKIEKSYLPGHGIENLVLC